MKRAVVITVSDKGSQGLRADTSGPAVADMLRNAGYDVADTLIVPDEQKQIEETLIHYADKRLAELIVTTGGTGFSIRDVTPEATLAVVEREVRGIPEVMRSESMKVTPNGMLSRAAAGLRGFSLIVNLPGSKKAASECLGAVLPALDHGLDILLGSASECGNDSETKVGN
jgi:molybdopterin adenylyltransferase